MAAWKSCAPLGAWFWDWLLLPILQLQCGPSPLGVNFKGDECLDSHTVNVCGLLTLTWAENLCRYFEWGINVPILFILSGYCSLGRPLHEVSRPLIVTNIYVIFSWAAAASTSGLLKWMCLFCTLNSKLNFSISSSLRISQRHFSFLGNRFNRGLFLSHLPSSDGHLLTCWLGLTSSSVQRPKTYQAVTFDPGSPTA